MSIGSTKELCDWLREHSSGAYHRSREAAGIIEQLERQNARLRASLEAARPVADAWEAVYQIEATLKDGLHWRDTNEQVYSEHFPQHRRKLYRAAPSARMLSEDMVRKYPDDLATAICRLARERGTGFAVGRVRAFLAATSAPSEAANLTPHDADIECMLDEDEQPAEAPSGGDHG
jgi:hypothetical protein